MIRKLILGTVQMGIDYGINNPGGRIDDKESLKILNAAYTSGITHVDSAETYGKAHSIIGEFHRLNPDREFRVTTKMPPVKNPDQILKKLESYCSQMHIKNAETVMIHLFDTYLHQSELKDVLIDLKIAGQFRSLGVSVYNNEQAEVLLTDDAIDIIQLPFNLFDNSNARGNILKKAKQAGKEIHVRSVFLQGLFFKDPEDDHPVVRPLKSELLKIRELASNFNVPLSTLALQYCLQQPEIDMVIVGVDSLEQLNSNIDACKNVIPTELMAEIDDIHIAEKKLINPLLWN